MSICSSDSLPFHLSSTYLRPLCSTDLLSSVSFLLASALFLSSSSVRGFCVSHFSFFRFCVIYSFSLGLGVRIIPLLSSQCYSLRSLFPWFGCFSCSLCWFQYRSYFSRSPFLSPVSAFSLFLPLSVTTFPRSFLRFSPVPCVHRYDLGGLSTKRNLLGQLRS